MLISNPYCADHFQVVSCKYSPSKLLVIFINTTSSSHFSTRKVHLSLQKNNTYRSSFYSHYDIVDFLFFGVAGKHQIAANIGQGSSVENKDGCAGWKKTELAQGLHTERRETVRVVWTLCDLRSRRSTGNSVTSSRTWLQSYVSTF